MGGGNDLLGREAEKEYAAEIADGALGGAGRVLLLLGEAGIGKSSLGGWISGRAAAGGAAVARVACSGAAGAPWSPWAAALTTLGVRAEALPPLHPAHGRALARLLSSDTGTDDDDDLHPGVVAEALAGALAAAAAVRPTIILVEDVHHADGPSLEVFPVLDRAIAGMPLLVVATARTPDAHTRPEFAAALAATAGYAVIALRPLAPSDTLELVARVTGTTLDESVARPLVEATGGNPLFAVELGRLLRQGGGSASTPVSAADLPRTGAIIRHRLAAIGERPRHVLELAAVAAPAPATLSLLAAAAGVPRSTVEDLIEEVVPAGLIRCDGAEVRFVHALVRDELIRQVSPTRRTSMHRDLGVALLAESGAAPEDVAHHLLRAEDAESSATAVRFLRMSAMRGRALGAYETAARQLDLALALAPATAPPEDLAELLLTLADCRFRLGNKESALEAATQAAAIAREANDAIALARSVLVRREHAYVDPTAMEPEIVAAIDESLSAVGADRTRERSMLLAQRAIEMMFSSPLADRRRLAEEAVAIARELRDEAALGYALRSLAAALPLDEMDAVVEMADELVALAERLGDPMLELHGRGRRASAYLTVGDAARFEEEVAAVRLLAERGRQPVQQWAAGVLRTAGLIRRGALDEAEALADEVAEVLTATSVANRFTALATARFAAAVAGGRPDEGFALVAQLHAAAPQVPVIRAGYALSATLSGRSEEALTVLPILVTEAPGWRRDLLWVPSMCWTAWAVSLEGASDWAAELLPLLRPSAALHVSTSMGHPVDYWGPVAFYVGALEAATGQYGAADDSFADAEAACARVGARAFLIQVRLARARALRERPGPSHFAAAAELLGVAAAAADELGLRPLVDEIGGLTPAASPQLDGEVTLAERTGEWELQVGGRSWRLRNNRGAAYLAALVEHGGAEVHVLDLVADVSGGGLINERGEPWLDSVARARIRSKLQELKQQADLAEAAGDDHQVDLTRAEMEELARYLLQESTPSGRPRKRSPVLERARTATTKALRRVIAEVSERDAAVGRELTERVQTGVFCRFDSPVGTKGRNVKVNRGRRSG